MRELKKFLTLDSCFRDVTRKIVPSLAERDDFEAKYEQKLPCPSCGDETGSGLFYRMLDQDQWLPVGETMRCSTCRDREAFNQYQGKSLEDLRASITDRLTEEYFRLPEKLKDAGFKNFEETHNITAAAKSKAIMFTKEFLKSDEYNLLIMGNPGTGKSHLCAAIARTVKERGFSVGYLTSGKLLSLIKETYKKGATKSEEEVFQDIKKLDLLILDDVGSEALSKNEDWRKGMIFEVVESRSGKPTIYTSNLSDMDLPVAVGKRVYSRLLDNTKFIDIFIENYDYRKNLQLK